MNARRLPLAPTVALALALLVAASPLTAAVADGSDPLPLAAAEEAVRKNPDSDSYYQRGRSLAAAGEHERALADFAKAHELDPSDPYALTAMGVEYSELGKRDDELRAYDAAIAVDPKFSAALINRAIALREQERWGEAVQAYERAVQVVPERSDLITSIGYSLEQAGDPTRAGKYYERATKADPKSADAWLENGRFLKRQKKYKDAVRSFDRALAIEPSVDALTEKADALISLERVPDAGAVLDEALKLHPKSAVVRNQRGLFFFLHKDDNEAALKEFDAAVELDPKLDIAWYNRGLVHRSLGQHDRAIRDFNASLALAPGDADSLFFKGRCYSSLEDPLLAIDYFTATIAADKDYGEAYLWRSKARTLIGDAAGAKADAEMAAKLGATES